MKVTLNLDLLLKEGSIDQDEYDKFRGLSARGTTALAFNILVAFGVVAVGGATLALLPTPATAIALGVAVSAASLALVAMRVTQWRVLANICIVVGALLFAGGIIKLGEGSVGALLLVALVFGCAAVFARSALLSALAVLALAACLGARTGYLHAMYFLGIEWPTLTIVVFTLLGALLYELSKHVPVDYRSVVMAAARTSVFLVNFGFWIGSLWGDHRIGPIVKDNSSFAAVWAATWVFALLWAIALLAAGIWAWKRDRRWLVNVVAIFGAIDFYTQWFERLGASPRTVLIAGLAALAFAIGLRAFNAKSTPA